MLCCSKIAKKKSSKKVGPNHIVQSGRLSDNIMSCLQACFQRFDSKFRRVNLCSKLTFQRDGPSTLYTCDVLYPGNEFSLNIRLVNLYWVRNQISVNVILCRDNNVIIKYTLILNLMPATRFSKWHSIKNRHNFIKDTIIWILRTPRKTVTSKHTLLLRLLI